jgi:hypothetical protein
METENEIKSETNFTHQGILCTYDMDLRVNITESCHKL